VGGPLGAALHVGGVLRQGADAGDGEVGLELLDVAVAVRVDIVDDAVHEAEIVLRSGPRAGFDRQILPVPPFLPRSRVIADARVAEQAQRQVAVRGAVAALTVRHHFLVRRHTGALVHLAQLVDGLEPPVWSEVARPFDMDRAGDPAAALRPHQRAGVLVVAARVEDDDIPLAEARLDVAPRRDRAFLRRAGPGALCRRDRVARDRQARTGPRAETAVEHLHVGMAEV